MLERAGQVVGPDWSEFNDQRCLGLTLPRPKGPADLQAHRFHMTMARILLSHTDALVSYKYCNCVDNNHPEEDVWVAHRWIADLKTHTRHRVLPESPCGQTLQRSQAPVCLLDSSQSVVGFGALFRGAEEGKDGKHSNRRSA